MDALGRELMDQPTGGFDHLASMKLQIPGPGRHGPRQVLLAHRSEPNLLRFGQQIFGGVIGAAPVGIDGAAGGADRSGSV